MSDILNQITVNDVISVIPYLLGIALILFIVTKAMRLIRWVFRGIAKIPPIATLGIVGVLLFFYGVIMTFTPWYDRETEVYAINLTEPLITSETAVYIYSGIMTVLCGLALIAWTIGRVPSLSSKVDDEEADLRDAAHRAELGKVIKERNAEIHELQSKVETYEKMVDHLLSKLMDNAPKPTVDTPWVIGPYVPDVYPNIYCNPYGTTCGDVPDSVSTNFQCNEKSDAKDPSPSAKLDDALDMLNKISNDIYRIQSSQPAFVQCDVETTTTSKPKPEKDEPVADSSKADLDAMMRTPHDHTTRAAAVAQDYDNKRGWGAGFDPAIANAHIKGWNWWTDGLDPEISKLWEDLAPEVKKAALNNELRQYEFQRTYTRG